MSTPPRPDEVLWRGSLHSAPMATLIISVLILLTGLTVVLNDTTTPEKQIHGLGWLWYSLTMGFAGLAVIVFLWISVEVRRDGFFIAFGPFGWPRRKISWNKVAQVEHITVRPTEWGGWGYRAVPWKKATAVVLRKGSGLKFTLAGNRLFVITLDDAGGALAAVERALHPESEHHCDHDH